MTDRFDRDRQYSPENGISRGVRTLNQDGLMWLGVTNLIIWTGLFLYLMRIDSKLRQKEKDS